MNFPFQKERTLSKEEIAELLNMSPEAYDSFEHAYQSIGKQQKTENFLDISIKDMKKETRILCQYRRGWIKFVREL